VSAALILCLLGIAVAVAAHLGCRAAEHRASEAYRELVGENYDLPEDGWREIRPVVGGWGCLVPALAFLRGLGVALPWERESAWLFNDELRRSGSLGVDTRCGPVRRRARPW
jgi:hypothetical protein